MKIALKLLICVFLFTTLSCSDDEENTPEVMFYVKAKIDGSGYVANEISVLNIGNALLVTGSKISTNSEISFSINNYNGVGSYVIGDNINNESFIQYVIRNGSTNTISDSWQNNLATSTLGSNGPQPASVIVTLDDGKVIEGTFSFEGYNNDDQSIINVTEGEFKVEL